MDGVLSFGLVVVGRELGGAVTSCNAFEGPGSLATLVPVFRRFPYPLRTSPHGGLRRIRRAGLEYEPTTKFGCKTHVRLGIRSCRRVWGGPSLAL